MIAIVLLYITCFTLYFLFFFLIYKTRCIFGTGKRLRNVFAYCSLSLLCSAILTGLVNFNLHISGSYIVFCAMVFILLLTLTNEALHVTVINTVWLMLTQICVRAVIITVLSTFSGTNIPSAMQLPKHRLITLILSLAVNIICLWACIFLRERLGFIAKLYLQKKYIYFTSCIGAVLFIYQVYCAEAFYYSFNFLWFNIVHILGTVLTLTSFYIMLWHCIRSNIWLDSQHRLQTLETLLQRQLLHYRAFTEYSASIRTFKHDYNKIISVVRSLLYQGDGQKALTVLDEMDYSIQEDILVHNQFSNNMLIDAALQELATECLAKGIAFDASVHIPTWLNISQLDLSSLFTAICAQLSARCNSASDNMHRYIRITGEGVNSWFILSGETVFSDLICSNDVKAEALPESLSSNSVAAIQNIAKAYGGFANIEMDTVKLIFKLKLYISNSQNTHGHSEVNND